MLVVMINDDDDDDAADGLDEDKPKVELTTQSQASPQLEIVFSEALAVRLVVACCQTIRMCRFVRIEANVGTVFVIAQKATASMSGLIHAK